MEGEGETLTTRDSLPPSPSTSSSSEPPPTPPNLHQNSIDPSSRWLVQKFGGTSVGKFPVEIAKGIISNYIDGNKIAVVCSARSGSTKALGTTNLLLRAASETKKCRQKTPSWSGTATPLRGTLFSQLNDEISHSQSPSDSTSPSVSASPRTSLEPKKGFTLTVDFLMKEHLEAARASVTNPKLLKELEDEIGKDCAWLREFLFAAQILDEMSPRSRDTIAGLGERLACKIMTTILRDQGIDAEYVSLEDIVPETLNYDVTHKTSLNQSFYDQIALEIGKRIKQCEPRVPVVTGFFGPVPGSLLDQVGRGYTDLLAALLAVGLDAAELQIWKEVDGIFTADPRKVPTARLLSVVSPDEAAELTYYGSEVVHPFTMEQAIKKKIPIRIKNVENPKGGGTVICPDPDVDAAELQHELGPSPLPEPTSYVALSQMTDVALAHHHQKLPTAVTIKENVMILNVNSNRKSVSHGFLAGIFGTLDRFGVVVDLISTSEVHVSMAIADGMSGKLLERLVRELEKSGPVSVHNDMAILSLVGKQMRNMVGIAGRMFSTLAQGGVNIEMISQGASEINISCVISARDAVKALNLIHQTCLQIRPEGATGRIGPWLF